MMEISIVLFWEAVYTGTTNRLIRLSIIRKEVDIY